MKNRRNQIQNRRELSSHYVIRSERYLGRLFAFFWNMQYGFTDL